MTVQTASSKKTQEFGEKFAKRIRGGGVVALYGDLGAGKTTLVQGIARGLGIKDRIVSPTFILVRRYELPAPSLPAEAQAKEGTKPPRYLWHVDLYRLNSQGEGRAVGIEEIMSDPQNVVLIEWPEKIEELLPKKRYNIYLKEVGESKRKISIAKL